MLSRFAHAGQVDRAGVAYYKHPLAVSQKVSGENEKIVALLHDVLEDTWVKESTIRNLFGDEVADAVLSVTKHPNEDYFAFVKRAKANPTGKVVKLADLEHNSDLSRIPNPTKEDYERLEKYKTAIQILLD